jgi:hypothetical protein
VNDGGIADVDDGDVRRGIGGLDRGPQRLAVADRGNDLVAAPGEQLDQAVAEHGGVLGDHDAHGSLLGAADG